MLLLFLCGELDSWQWECDAVLRNFCKCTKTHLVSRATGQGGEPLICVVLETRLSNVGTINHPFGNGLDQLSMVIWGMVYKYCYTHIADLLELRPAFHADCKATWQTD